MGRGYYFQGNCASPNGWLGNAVSNSYGGLELKTSGVIGIQGAISGATLAANTWSNVTEETYVSGTTNANTTSYMYVGANGTYTTAPGLNYGTASQTYSVGPGDGIRIITGTPFDCSGGGCGGCRTGSLSDSSLIADIEALYAGLVNTPDSVFPEYADEMIYQNRQLAYRLQDQNLLTTLDNSELQNFYATNQTSNIGKFTSVQTAVANNQTSQALSTNSVISPSNAIEQKTQRANELMLKWNMDCNYSFSPAELQDLITMAGEWPVKGWYVAQSRSIINSLSGTLIKYTDDCEETEESNRLTAKENVVTESEPQQSFKLFPNPNNGSMTLFYDLGKDKEAEFSLYDITGKLINTYKIQNTVGTLEINEGTLYNGIYFYRILVSGNIINTNKVVIIK